MVLSASIFKSASERNKSIEQRGASFDGPRAQFRKRSVLQVDAQSPNMIGFNFARQRMVDTQLRARGISDARILDAMLRVPRHEFVSEALRAEAYEDHPLPIGDGQTISQPYVVAVMLESLQLTP